METSNFESSKWKLYSFIFVIFLSLSLVSALSPQTYDNMNFFDKIKYSFSTGLFSSWGQANDCSINPDYERYALSGSSVHCNEYCSYDKCAIDIWYDNIIYLGTSKPSGYPSNPNWGGLTYYKEVTGTGASNTFSSSHQYWYYQIYCCPKDTTPTPTHETQMYRCENGRWSSYGSFGSTESCSYDTSGANLCWCSSSSQNFYIDESRNVHCASSPSSSWCSAPISHASYKCWSNAIYWFDSYGGKQELKENCPGGCVNLASSCNNIICADFDNDCNGLISRAELGVAITQWANGQLSRSSLGEVIQKWSLG